MALPLISKKVHSFLKLKKTKGKIELVQKIHLKSPCCYLGQSSIDLKTYSI